MFGLVIQLRALFCAIIFVAGVGFCSAGHALVISQIYGGGGNKGATYTNDFIEIFNDSPNPADLNAVSVQYASSSGTTWYKTELSGTLAAYSYYLIQEAAGSNGFADLPRPNAEGAIALSSSSGKVALVDSLELLSSLLTPLNPNPCRSNVILDLVGYGSADCYEGTAAASSASNAKAVTRLLGGLMDSNDNLADFILLAPNPRNNAYAANAPVGAAPGQDINTVNEPVSVLLLAAGLLALPWRGRWQRRTSPCAVSALKISRNPLPEKHGYSRGWDLTRVGMQENLYPY